MAKSFFNELKALSGQVAFAFANKLVGADGASITSVPDQSTGGACTFTPGASKPVVKRFAAAAIASVLALVGQDEMLWTTTNNAIALTTFGNLVTGGWTAILSIRPDRVDTSANYAFLCGPANAPNLFAVSQTDRPVFFNASIGSTTNVGPDVSNQPTTYGGAGGCYQLLPGVHNIVIIRRNAGNTFDFWVNGEARDSIAGGTLATITQLFLGNVAGGTFPFSGGIGFVSVYNRAISNTERTDIGLKGMRYYRFPPLSLGLSVASLGHSINFGNYGNPLTASYWDIAVNGMTSIPAINRHSFRLGVPSIGTAGMDAIFIGGFKVFFALTGNTPLFYIDLGTNDISLYTRTAAQTYTLIQTLCTDIKAQCPNAIIIVQSVMPRNTTAAPANETTRTAYHLLLMANTVIADGSLTYLYAKSEPGVPIDYVMALHLNATMGIVGSDNNATNYLASDKTHYTTAGHLFIGNLIAPEIYWLWNNLLTTRTIPIVTAVASTKTTAVVGTTTQLTASVTGTNSPSGTVVWTVQDGEGDVDYTTGVFDALTMAINDTTTIRVSSAFDMTIFTDFTLTITAAPPPVTNTPTSIGAGLITPLNKFINVGRIGP